MEFEHTFAFSPDGFDENGISSTAHSSQIALREGRLVVVKGESRFRNIPYPNWYYYLWPFNWFGLSPDGPSRRFEADERPSYTIVGEAIRLPAYAVGGLFSDSRSDALPVTSWIRPERPASDPTMLAVDGYHLVRCIHLENMLPPEHRGSYKDEKSDFKDRFKRLHDISDKENDSNQVCRFKPIYPSEDSKIGFIGSIGSFGESLIGLFGLGPPPVVPNNLYSEKTHTVMRIHKTKGTLGSFDELLSHFSDHAATINEVTTSSSEAKNISDARIEAAFSSVQAAIEFERTKRKIRDDAKQGIVKEIDVKNKIKDSKDEETLRKINIQEHTYNTKESILDYARAIKDRPDMFFEMVEFIRHRRMSWETLQPGAKYYDDWLRGWGQVVESVRGTLQQYPNFQRDFSFSVWEDLIAGDCMGSRERPAVSIGSLSILVDPLEKTVVAKELIKKADEKTISIQFLDSGNTNNIRIVKRIASLEYKASEGK